LATTQITWTFLLMRYQKDRLRFLKREGIGAAVVAVVAFIALIVVVMITLSNNERGMLFSSPVTEQPTHG
jgi:hypothetical protein